MTARRLVTSAATFVVAVVLALGVPFAQLRTVSFVPVCCCPDPDTCKCFDHQPTHDGPSMAACHKNQPDVATTPLAAFVTPAQPSTSEPPRAAMAVSQSLALPHAPPTPRRPDAPS